MKHSHLSAAMVVLAFTGAAAAEQAPSLSTLGYDILHAQERVEVDGYFRWRGEVLNNLDLDHGLTPSGLPLYPVPLSGGQNLTTSDMRLRTDISIYSPLGDVAVKARLDVIDNLSLGSTPSGPPQTTTTQDPTLLSVKRAWAEVLTPFGLLSVGRMGAHWGLGILANAGDCLECDSGDAADRIAFITPIGGHILAAAYDIGYVGPWVEQRQQRYVDIEPSDDVKALTFAFLNYDTPQTLERRRNAERATFNYGLTFSYRWQTVDTPSWYLPNTTSTETPVVPRNLSAWATDMWLRFDSAWGRVEVEAVYVGGEIEDASLLPGVIYPEPLTTNQWGAALETEFGRKEWWASFGVDAGIASGDGAPGFGVNPGPFDTPAEPGDLDGPQSRLPSDNAVNNFEFHPDYRVDQILFREIIGTVTDAVYVRPHVDFVFGRVGQGNFRFEFAGIYSQALNAASTPGQDTPLGIELNPSLKWEGTAFSAALDYAILMPLSGMNNPRRGLEANEAQLLRLQLWTQF